MNLNQGKYKVGVIAVSALLLAAACTDSSDGNPSADNDESTEGQSASAFEAPSHNTFLADSTVPIGHGDSGQTDWSPVSGPTGPTETLSESQLTYQHLGPAHFGIAISPEYPDGDRVIWSNGGDRISKLDYETLDVLAELQLAGKSLQSAVEADAEIDSLDTTEGADRADVGLTMAANYLAGLAGVYYILDSENTLFVGGSDSIIAYSDTDPTSADSPIEISAEWEKPSEIGGEFVGANITFDGHLAMVTNQGWVVVVDRDFQDYKAIQISDAADSAAYNESMIEQGFRPGAADWVRNSVAIDEDGGIYVISKENLHKVIWDGEQLSVDEGDGAWTEPYLSSLQAGSGATPSLMGFGEEDRFVVITDGEAVMNVVPFWRDAIPDGWTQLDGTPSRRIAGQLPALIGDDDRAAIQTEQSVVVGGYGAFVVNNEPRSIPDGFPAIGNRLLAGYAGSDPAFSPKGVEKFEWDPERQEFAEAWVNKEVGSPNSVPIVSADLSHVYTVGARDGQWTLEGIDWDTGESAFHWTTGSNRYNSLFSGVNLDQEGRVIHTTMFGVVRYNP